MGIFSGSNRVKGKSPTTTLIAEGCTIIGDIQIESVLQIDGHFEGQIEAKTEVKISKTGYVLGNITTERLIINGHYEGTCRADYVDILSCGSLTGEVVSDCLSIEPGGKFMGVTNPAETSPANMLSHQKEQKQKPEKEAMLINESSSTMAI